MASWSTCATSFEQEILQLIRAKGGTQQYPYPSHVNPFGIVSIKLSGQKNYNLWQEQMVCLIESHGMQGFIDGRYKNPKDNDDSQSTDGEATKYEEWKRSDSLIKGWIFGSLNENVMGTVVGLPTAMDVWKKLNTTHATHNKGTQQYPYPSHVRPNDFLYTQLSGQNNYNQWQEQMECLIESYGMQGFINGNFKNPKENIDDSQNIEGETTKYEEWKRSDSLVKGWIFGSLSEDVMDVVVGIPTAMDVWKKLNTTYSTDNKGTQQYPYPSHVRPNDFVSIVLSGEKNYDRWREQMECLIESHGMWGFIQGRFKNLKHNDGTINYEEWKRSDSLVKEWIFGSLNENIKEEVVHDLPTAWDVWEHLNSFHHAVTTSDDIDVPIDDMEEEDSNDNVQDIENQETLISRCWRSCFHTRVLQFYFNYPLHYFIQMIYLKFWEITLLHVPHIKHLKKDKEKHNIALTLLRRICHEVGQLRNYSDIEEHLYIATNVATRNNTSEAIKEIIMHFPQAYDLTHQFYDYSMIQLAIKNRSEKVYNLLVHDLSTKNCILKDRVDKDGNNLLHLAGELAPIHRLNVVSGAALQMQRELQWFKEVEKLVENRQKKANNKKQETPFMMFRREHLKLRKEGEEWMKKTADSYTITATLIITIVFAAAITIPGGNSDTGKAVYATKTSFTVFTVSDAISLFTSITSLLLFLSILTTRYRDEDFLYRLPKRLILGLVMLFLSVTSLMVAFSATLYLTFGQEKAWILIPIAALTCLPITSFVTLQFPLLVELISSTYGSGIFGKNK